MALIKQHQATKMLLGQSLVLQKAFIEDCLLPACLAKGADAASAQGLDFATYCPGELLKKWSELSSMVVPPEYDNASECSTTDTQRPIQADTPPLAESGACSEEEGTQSDIVLPSIGSLGHSRGLCKPCGFVHHKDGCSLAASCTFCHLCSPGVIEKQRRSKRRLVKAVQRTQA